MWRSSLRAVLDLLAPPRCPGCDFVEKAGGFCPACWPLLDPLPALAADPVDWTAYEFRGPLADAIRRFKYGGRDDLAAPLADALLQVLPTVPLADVVLPVPLHPRRLRVRGYNQSGLLASRLARHLRLPVRYDLLRRTRDSVPQVGLSRSERADNVRDAFRAAPEVSGLRCVLVDDVRTSGATLGAVRAALRGAGSGRVSALVLAQAPEDGTTQA